MTVWYVTPQGQESSGYLLINTLLSLRMKLRALLHVHVARSPARHLCARLLSSPCLLCSRASSTHTATLALTTSLSLVIKPLDAMVATTSLAETLVTAATSADIAILLRLKGLHIVILAI
jgi:hypothetical protein